MTEKTIKSPEELKEELEKAFKRLRPKISGNSKSVAERVSALANRPDEQASQETTKTAAKKPKNLAELAKDGRKIDERARKAGLEAPHLTKEKDKDDKNKDKDKEKDKDKKKEKENDKNKKKDNNRDDVISTIKLPSNARIVEHANKWEIVSTDKNGQDVATDITDVMNNIDKFNKDVNEANKQRKAMSLPEMKDEDKGKNITSVLPNLYSENDRAVYKTPDEVKPTDIPAIKPEDFRDVVKYAISLSDGDKLYKKINDRDKNNQQEKDEKNRLLLHERGGR